MTQKSIFFVIVLAVLPACTIIASIVEESHTTMYSTSTEGILFNSPTNPQGSNMVMEKYEVPEKKLCSKCSGSGKCFSCKGSGAGRSSGVRTKNAYSGLKRTCHICHGSGNCNQCKGNKYVTTYVTKYRYVKKEPSPATPSSNYNSPSYGNSTNSSPKVSRICSWCNGSGRILKETGQQGFSVQGKENGKCSECGEQLYKGKSHKHYNCSYCKGTGKL